MHVFPFKLALQWLALHVRGLGGYDYIIVGAGSAGATIAHRLVKDAGARVLLIENGSSHYGRWDWWKINMPGALTYNLADAPRRERP